MLLRVVVVAGWWCSERGSAVRRVDRGNCSVLRCSYARVERAGAVAVSGEVGDQHPLRIGCSTGGFRVSDPIGIHQ